MYAGCYTLHLYCDHATPPTFLIQKHGDADTAKYFHTRPEWEYTGNTFSECKRAAQESGWRFHKDGLHSCPYCTRSHRSKPTIPKEFHAEI